jgi:glycosyltransferase involved in cell wall biosynthesis
MENKKTKRLIQIPCLNESSTLPRTFKEIPKTVKGIDIIETLVIDDGSIDNTKIIAKELGVTHIISFTGRKGLARAFMTGIDASLKLGADIIVNLDADGQYNPTEIPKLIQPILDKKADMVIGSRDIDNLKHFSFLKKKLQRMGSLVVRKMSGTNVPDVTSGFRAFSKQAALSINVISDFTYTIETLIQAGNENLVIKHIPINARVVLRKSRLFKTMKEYITKSITTMLRIYTMYKPFKVFTIISSIIFILGILIFLKFLQFHFEGTGTRHIQYLIVSVVALLLAFQVFLIGLIADLISANRKLTENVLRRIKKLELKSYNNKNE